MPSSDNIRAAMRCSDFAAMEWSRDVLAACVWELYEALGDCYHCYMLNEGGSTHISKNIEHAVSRYSAALEGGDDE